MDVNIKETENEIIRTLKQNQNQTHSHSFRVANIKKSKKEQTKKVQ